MDGRRAQVAAGIAPLLGSPAERASVRSSPTTAVRGASSKISKMGYPLQSSTPPFPFGCSVPSPLSTRSTSSHPLTSASGNLVISGSKPSTRRVSAATKLPQYNHQCFCQEPHFRYGEEVSSTSHPSSITRISPVSSLPRLASTPPKGSRNMCPPEAFQNKPTSSSHGSPLKDSTSEGLSWSRGRLNSSVSSSGASFSSSPVASHTSLRNPCIINRSIQSLLRCGKTKQTKLGAYPSLPSLTANLKADDEPRAVHKSNFARSLTKTAILSSAYAHSEVTSSCTSPSSVRSVHPRSPLASKAYAATKESRLNRSISESSLKSARSYYSTVDSDASYSPLSTPTFGDAVSCLSVTYPTLPKCQTAIFTGSLSASDHLDSAGDHVDVKVTISNSAEKRTPLIEVTEEESDGDDSEAEDILANLRSIAATKSPKAQSWGSDSHSSLYRNSTSSSLNSDQYSVDCSDTRSEFSFDAEMDEEGGPDFFPLPSWPTLSSTSQSPLHKKASSSNIRPSSTCPISNHPRDSIAL